MVSILLQSTSAPLFITFPHHIIFLETGASFGFKVMANFGQDGDQRFLLLLLLFHLVVDVVGFAQPPGRNLAVSPFLFLLLFTLLARNNRFLLGLGTLRRGIGSTKLQVGATRLSWLAPASWAGGSPWAQPASGSSSARAGQDSLAWLSSPSIVSPSIDSPSTGSPSTGSPSLPPSMDSASSMGSASA